MSTMNEARFHDLVDALQQQVEDAFDDSDLTSTWRTPAACSPYASRTARS